MSEARLLATVRSRGGELADFGSAEMHEDGTIELAVQTTGNDGRRRSATMLYPPSHPRHGSVMERLGGIVPGELKPLPPWSERIPITR